MITNKNIKNRILIFLLVGFIFISLTSCSKLSSSSLPSANLKDVYVGYDGIKTTIDNPSVLSNFYPGSTLPLVLRLENKGSYDVQGGLVYLDFDKSFFDSVNGPSESFDLSAKNQFSAGEFTIKEMSLTNEGKSIPSKNKNTYLIVKTCYPYLTKLTTDMCFGNPGSNGCDYNNYKLLDKTSQGQGAPIYISKITENVVELKDDFEIYLDVFVNYPSNSLITLPDQATALCTGNEVIKNLNRVRVDSVSISGEDIRDDCMFGSLNNDYFDLSRRHFVCRVKHSKSEYSGSFVTPISIQLSYGFTQVDQYTIQFNNLQDSLLN